MIVLIPFRESIPKQVINSIESQGALFQTVKCNYDINIQKRKRIILAKTRCKELGLATTQPYVAINDADLEHTRIDNFMLMHQFLEQNKDFGAVSLLRDGTFHINKGIYDSYLRNHICSGSVLFSRAGLESVNFDDGVGLRPTCYEIGKSLAEANLKYAYLDEIKRIRTIGA